MKGNNFYSSLNYEDQQKPRAELLYKSMGFYNIKRCSWDTDGGKKNQRDDIDVIMRDTDGKIVHISEKFRAKDWGDMMIELYSSFNPGKYHKSGWGLTSKADYYFYFVPKKLYTIPTQDIAGILHAYGLDIPENLNWFTPDQIESLKNGKSVRLSNLPFKHDFRLIPTTLMGEEKWRGLTISIPWRVLLDMICDIKEVSTEKFNICI